MVTHPCINQAHDCLTSVIKNKTFTPCYVSPHSTVAACGGDLPYDSGSNERVKYEVMLLIDLYMLTLQISVALYAKLMLVNAKTSFVSALSIKS